MKFLICLKQSTEGCDYTIGCGMKFEVIEASSLEDAKEKVIYPEGLEENSIFENTDISYDDIKIVSMEHVFNLDVEGMEEQILKKRREKEEEEKRLEDEAEFERLKRKLNKWKRAFKRLFLIINLKVDYNYLQ